ncbi:MAG: DUF4430 domain-containing protein [Candidatus Izimaplasma sp.]|nr:DUF4430 domain-containing protein [Candidatus Izimaplasma bacterium]
MKKIGLSIGIIFVTVIAVFLLTRQINDTVGEIRFVVKDQSDNIIIDDRLAFSEDDDLVTILEDNYTVYCASETYQPTLNCDTTFVNGRVILGIEDIVTDWNNTYIGIYINGTYSSVGVDSIALRDGDTIIFEVMTLGDE